MYHFLKTSISLFDESIHVGDPGNLSSKYVKGFRRLKVRG